MIFGLLAVFVVPVLVDWLIYSFIPNLLPMRRRREAIFASYAGSAC